MIVAANIPFRNLYIDDIITFSCPEISTGVWFTGRISD